jgi:DNA-binding MarR family transcriptional regulator
MDRHRALATATGATPGGGAGGDDACIALAELLAQTSRRLRRGSMAQLTPLGITFAQARVLRVVAEAEQPLRMADIAARLEVVPRSVTSMVDALEAIGVVTRSVDPGDRRSVRVELADGGRDLLGRLDRARRASAEKIFGPLSDRERDELHRLLAALCQGAACPDAGGGR